MPNPANIELVGVIGAGSSAFENKQFYDRKLLMRAVPLLVHMQFGRKDGIPRNGGNSIEWRRFERPASATTALTEGTPPAETRITLTNVAATVSQYGAYSNFSDVLDLQGYDPFIASVSDMYGEHMGVTLDVVVRDVITAGTTLQNAGPAATRGGASGIGSGMRLNYAEIREAVETLARADARRFPDGYWAGIIHPDTTRDLFADPDIQSIFQNAQERGDNNPLMKGQVGIIHGVRFVETSQARIITSIGLSNADVYMTMLMGQEYYGVVDFEAQRPQVIVHNPGTSGSYDPLNQVGSIGWKAAIAAGRLNNAFAVRIEHTTTRGQALK